MGDHRSGEEMRLDEATMLLSDLCVAVTRTNVLLQRLITLTTLVHLSPENSHQKMTQYGALLSGWLKEDEEKK